MQRRILVDEGFQIFVQAAREYRIGRRAIEHRLPLAGLVSILHRISGALLVVTLPLIIWAFDLSVSSERAFDSLAGALGTGVRFVPAWCLRLAVWVLIGAGLLHLTAGLRHLWMDVTHRVSAEQGRNSGLIALAASLLVWLAAGAKLCGLY